MFSRIAQSYSRMAFQASPDAFARRAAARYAGDVLAAYLQGQERAYAVHDVLHELQALFHDGAVLPCRLIRQAVALPFDDEDARAALVTKALDMLGQQVRAEWRGVGSPGNRGPPP